MAWTAPRTWTDGELVTKAIMDPHVRDNFLAVGPHLVVRKPSDESVTSSTVQQNDDHLVMAVAANEVWRFEYMLRVDKGPGGMDIAWTFPTAGYFSAQWMHGGTVDVHTGTSPTADQGLATGTAGDIAVAYIVGVYANGANAGNLQLQFAQNASNGVAAIMKTNSTLWAVKLA